MGAEISFKERVKNTAIECSRLYKDYFVDYEYLICSEAFHENMYYIVDAHKDNYLHLIGVTTSLSAIDFFEGCYNGTLQEDDFDFVRKGQSEKEVKGSVRRKITALSDIFSVFTSSTWVEESFIKNKIRCTFATGKNTYTLGFIGDRKAKPMTLLKGNELDSIKARNIDLVLRRKTGEPNFKELVSGDKEMLVKYKDAIIDILSEDLKKILLKVINEE